MEDWSKEKVAAFYASGASFLDDSDDTEEAQEEEQAAHKHGKTISGHVKIYFTSATPLVCAGQSAVRVRLRVAMIHVPTRLWATLHHLSNPAARFCSMCRFHNYYLSISVSYSCRPPCQFNSIQFFHCQCCKRISAVEGAISGCTRAASTPIFCSRALAQYRLVRRQNNICNHLL